VTEIRKHGAVEKENSSAFARSNVVNESIRNYLDNITSVSVNSVCMEPNNFMSSDDDDTSIQERIVLKNMGKLDFSSYSGRHLMIF
jgi:hypothetical protein